MATTAAPAMTRPAESPRRAAVAGLATLAWLALVGVAVAWGTWRWADAGVSLRAAPLMGRWRLDLGPGLVRLVPAAALGAAVVRWGPAVAVRVRWRVVPALAGAMAAAWTLALAASDGWSRVTEPLTVRHEYEPLAARVDRLLPFLDTYVDRLGEYPIHVQGHPPGPVVVAWALDRVGLSGAGWLAVLAIAAWGAATAGALVAARAVAGEQAARRAAPALAVLPAAVWAGTSLDALFAGLVAAGVALAASAGARWSGRGAAAAGAVLAVALLCSYGAVPLLLVALTALVAAARRPPVRLAAMAAVTGGAVLGLVGLAGFWWPDGLAATHRAYWEGVGAQRPGLYMTVLGNPAALALAVGPATAAGLAVTLGGPARRAWTSTTGAVRRARSAAAGRADRAPAAGADGARRVGTAVGALRQTWFAGGTGPPPAARWAWVLPGAALAAVAAADLSQLSRGEVERIWLPFVPWLALAAPGDRRAWLAAQVALGLTLQSVLVSPW